MTVTVDAEMQAALREQALRGTPIPEAVLLRHERRVLNATVEKQLSGLVSIVKNTVQFYAQHGRRQNLAAAMGEANGLLAVAEAVRKTSEVCLQKFAEATDDTEKAAIMGAMTVLSALLDMLQARLQSASEAIQAAKGNK